jgi:hypothetical protein
MDLLNPVMCLVGLLGQCVDARESKLFLTRGILGDKAGSARESHTRELRNVGVF